MVKPIQEKKPTGAVQRRDITVKAVDALLWRKARSVQIRDGITMADLLESALRRELRRRAA